MTFRLWLPKGPLVEGIDYNDWSDPTWVFSKPERLFGTELLDRYFRVRYEESANWGGFLPMEVDS